MLPARSLSAALDGYFARPKKAAFTVFTEAVERATGAEVLAAARELLAKKVEPPHLLAHVIPPLARALGSQASEAADELLLALVEHPDDLVSGHACDVVLGGPGEASAAARRPVLGALARHLVKGDRLLPAAAVARHLLGGEDLGARIAALEDDSPGFAALLAQVHQRLAAARVPLTPSLWDVFRRRLDFLSVRFGEHLSAEAPVGLLLHVLASDVAELDDAVLAGLELRAQSSDVDALRAALPHLGQRPAAKRLHSLLERLRLQGAALPMPEEEGVGTDGGAVLLASEKALGAWKGQAVRVGKLARHRASPDIIVLPAQAVGVVRPEGEPGPWLLLEGTLAELWSQKAALRFKPTGLTVDAKSHALVLHDAAHEGRRKEPDSHLVVAKKGKRWALEDAKLDWGHVVRLVPLKK
ncbi:MAG: hypothetical protein AB1938_25735 [Myxococcota bacterium]